MLLGAALRSLNAEDVGAFTISVDSKFVTYDAD